MRLPLSSTSTLGKGKKLLLVCGPHLDDFKLWIQITLGEKWLGAMNILAYNTAILNSTVIFFMLQVQISKLLTILCYSGTKFYITLALYHCSRHCSHKTFSESLTLYGFQWVQLSLSESSMILCFSITLNLKY